MFSSFRRILFMLVTAAVIALPAAAWAQQSPAQGQGQDSGQTTGDTQNENQGRRGAWMRKDGMRKDGARKAGPRQHMEMLARKLNLTEEQRQQFQKIGQQMRQEYMSIHNDSSLAGDQKREKLQAMRKQSHMEMFSVLTPEQKEQLKQMREQQRKDHRKAPGDQASAKPKPASAGEDDDPFAGMISDDDDGPPGRHANIY